MANNIKLNNPLGNQSKQQKGSGFVNLNKILDANQNNQLGSTVAQGIGQGTQQVKQGLQSLKTGFQTDADKANLASAENKQAISDALKNIATGQTSISNQLAQQFGTFRSGQYSGPRELDPTKTVQLGARANEVQDFGQALQSGGDKTRVLQAFAGKGPYTAGQTKLDSLLLGQGPMAKQQLAEARQGSRGLTQQIGKEQEAARQLGDLRTGQAQQFATDVKGQLATNQTAINEAIAKAVLDAQTGRQGTLERYTNAIKNRDVSLAPELQRLSGVRTYGQDLTKALELGQDPTQQNVASELQRGQLQALAQLAGQDPTALSFAPDVYDPSKAVTLNEQKLQQILAGGEQQLQQKIAAIMNAPDRSPIYTGTNNRTTLPTPERNRQEAVERIKRLYGYYDTFK